MLFPAWGGIIEKAQAAHVAELEKKLAEVKAMSVVDYFEEVGFRLDAEHCKSILQKNLPEGAHAQWAAAYGKPWSIRLTYHDPARGCTIETSVNLDWSPR